MKKKEEWFKGLLQSHDIAFDREARISYHCDKDAGGLQNTLARLDFVIYKPDHLVICSVDEFQHVDYGVACDVARMSKVATAIRQSGDMRPVCWLRINPDTVRVNGERAKIPRKTREAVIIRSIRNSDQLLRGKEVAVHYLFYDVQDGVAAVTIDQEYDSHWKLLVGKPITE